MNDIVPVVKNMLDKQRDSLLEIAPPGWNKRRIARAQKSVMMALAENSELTKCSPLSIVTSTVKAVEMGLDLSSGDGHAYIVPFKGKAQLVVGYKGFIELAYRTGKVRSIRVGEVCERDKFWWEEGHDGLRFSHTHPWGDRGDVVGYFAVADMAMGGCVGVRMDLSEIEAIRARSRSGNFGPWKTDYSEMAKKTVVRRLQKLLPRTRELEMAEQTDNAVFGFEDIKATAAVSRAEELADALETEPEDVEAEVVDEQ